MVGLEVEEGAQEVQAISSKQRDGDVSEGFIVSNQPGGDVLVRQANPCSVGKDILREILPSVQRMWHREIDSVSRTPESDNVAEPEQNH